MMIPKYLHRVIDFCSAAAALIAAPIARLQSGEGYPPKLPLTYRIWDAFGVSPIPHHYYQPVPRLNEIPESVWEAHPPRGFDFNEAAQLALLSTFDFAEELNTIPVDK